jgi:hypothetical protein
VFDGEAQGAFQAPWLGTLGSQRFPDLRIDAVHDIGNRFRTHQILFVDLKAELRLQVHDEFEAVKAADSEIIDKQSFIPDPLGIHQERFRQDRFDSAVGVQ